MSGPLFDHLEPPEPARSASAPLADRMRPESLDDVVGQEVVDEGGYLRRAMAEDRVPSLILWGPPGTGKTTIARILAVEITCRFVPFSAVTSGIKQVKEVMAEAARLRGAEARRTLLFVDEIHRFNRAQQDAFLPYVENGDILLIGATTENPSFHINSALLSRCRLVVLRPLSEAELERVVTQALTDEKRGLGNLQIELEDDAMANLVQMASGDARRALNLVELVALDAAGDEVRRIDATRLSRVVQQKVLLYDKSGDEHFNLISALHKSLRESDPDAALYWLARMLTAGEAPLYIARRLVRFASEDVGLADPMALPQTLAAWDAYHRLGSPEGELALAQATLYLSMAPKSNSVYAAYGEVRRAVEEEPAAPVPAALRNAPTKLMKELGYGEGYVYAHAVDEGVGGIECLPENLADRRFYKPQQRGFERELSQRLEEFRTLKARVRPSSTAK